MCPVKSDGRLSKPTNGPSPPALGVQDSRVLRLLVNAVSLNPETIHALVRWWQTEQHAAESSLAFLVRQQLLTPIQSQWLHLAAKGFLAAEQLPRLLGDGLRERLEARLAQLADSPLAVSPLKLFTGT